MGLLAAESGRAAAIDLRNLDSYVLFALDELDFKGGNTGDNTRGIIDGGNVGVNNAGPPPGAADANLSIGANGQFVMSDGTHAVADYMRFGIEANVYEIFYNTSVGAFGGTADFQTTPIPDWNGGPLIPLDDILGRFPFDPERTTTDTADDVVVAKNETLNLEPGTYRDVNPKDGATLNLSAGLYDMRSLKLGQDVTVNMDDDTILYIDDVVRLNSGSFGENTSGLAQIYIGADGSSNTFDASQFGTSTGGQIYGQFFSLGNLRLGNGNDLYGRFWAQQIGSDFNDNVTYVAPNPVPEPATMLLLGFGLIGLAGIGRKKFLKK